MRLTTTFFAALFATLAATGAAHLQQPTRGQQPPQSQDPERPNPLNDSDDPTFGYRTFQERAEKLDKLFTGAWGIIRFQDANNAFPDEAVEGYLLVVDGYMSIEIQATWDDGAGFPDDMVLTGTYRYEWDEAARLNLTTLLGTSNFEYPDYVEFEPPGSRRSYEIEFSNDTLIMTRLDDRSGSRNTRFTFQRLRGSLARANLKRDFFGRVIEVDEEDAVADDEPRRRVRKR